MPMFLVDFDVKRYILFEDNMKEIVDYLLQQDLNIGCFTTLPSDDYQEDAHLFVHLEYKQNLWPLYAEVEKKVLRLLPMQMKSIYLFEVVKKLHFDLGVTNIEHMTLFKQEWGNGKLVHAVFSLPDDDIIDHIKQQIVAMYIKWVEEFGKRDQ